MGTIAIYNMNIKRHREKETTNTYTLNATNVKIANYKLQIILHINRSSKYLQSRKLISNPIHICTLT